MQHTGRNLTGQYHHTNGSVSPAVSFLTTPTNAITGRPLAASATDVTAGFRSPKARFFSTQHRNTAFALPFSDRFCVAAACVCVLSVKCTQPWRCQMSDLSAALFAATAPPGCRVTCNRAFSIHRATSPFRSVVRWDVRRRQHRCRYRFGRLVAAGGQFATNKRFLYKRSTDPGGCFGGEHYFSFLFGDYVDLMNRQTDVFGENCFAQTMSS